MIASGIQTRTLVGIVATLSSGPRLLAIVTRKPKKRNSDAFFKNGG